MKRAAITIGIVLLIGAIAVPVMARGRGWGQGDEWRGGHHMMGQGGRGPGAYGAPPVRGYNNLTDEQRTKMNELSRGFFNETETTRNELWKKSDELNAVMSSSNPDAEKAKAIQKEINDLRSKMAEVRTDFELEARKINPDGTSGFGRGYGRSGYGRHMRGNGPGMQGYGPGMRGNGQGMRGYGKGMGYGRPGRGNGPGYCWN